MPHCFLRYTLASDRRSRRYCDDCIEVSSNVYWQTPVIDRGYRRNHWEVGFRIFAVFFERTISMTRPYGGRGAATFSSRSPNQSANGRIFSSPVLSLETNPAVRPVTRHQIGSTPATRLASEGSGHRPEFGTSLSISIRASVLTTDNPSDINLSMRSQAARQRAPGRGGDSSG